MANADAKPPSPARAAPFALAATVLVSLPLVLGFFAHLHPAFDSFAHLRAHLAALLAAAALVLLALGFRRESLAAFLLAGGGFATTLPASTFHDAAIARPLPAGEERPVYRLIHLNLRFDHAEPGRVLSLIARERPDVLALNEVSDLWRDKLALIAGAYPHRLVCTGDNAAGGVAILSRRPLVDQAAACSSDGRFALATVDFGGRPVQVAALHLDWPWPWRQVAALRRLAPILEAMDDAAILAADLNATPWSATFAALVAAGNFAAPTRAGPTWLPYGLPAALRPLVGLPIDHVMAREGVAVHVLRALDDVGSDHMPVLMEFSVMPEPAIQPVAIAALAES